jgi:alpha 1,2-mannosyltransferase
MINYQKEKTVIVYLAMNTKRDESYGRDSASMLVKSLDSLYQNYNEKFKHDIIIFYDKNHVFLPDDQKRIANGREEIKFQLLDGDLWSPPDCEEIRKNPNPSNWTAPHFSVGYRNMMRWYGILIYKFLTDLGYEMYMRMDDDSLLHSTIDYDLFEFLHKNDYDYGFRCYVNDHISVSNGLIEFCHEYIKDKNLSKHWIDRFINQKTNWKSSSYNILGYYNNFLISKLDFWMRDDVQKFLKHFDESGFMYTRRWNDLVSQAVTIQLFMDREKIYQFTDWTYEHATFGNYDSQNHLTWGGLYPKIENNKYVLNEYCEKWFNKYNIFAKNSFQTLDIKNCLNVKPVSLKDNWSKSFCLGKAQNINNVYDQINDYLLNCFGELRNDIQFSYKTPYGFVWLNNNSYGDKYNDILVINSDVISEVYSEQDKASGFILNRNIIVNPCNYEIGELNE